MKKLLIIFIIFLQSCSSSTKKQSLKNDFNFIHDISFDNFVYKLKEYAKNNPYPNIDD
tara:strand:- start:472 stop:645 length:174 start_codon:yes stop_codon:yes gene_type:complete